MLYRIIESSISAYFRLLLTLLLIFFLFFIYSLGTYAVNHPGFSLITHYKANFFAYVFQFLFIVFPVIIAGYAFFIRQNYYLKGIYRHLNIPIQVLFGWIFFGIIIFLLYIMAVRLEIDHQALRLQPLDITTASQEIPPLEFIPFSAQSVDNADLQTPEPIIYRFYVSRFFLRRFREILNFFSARGMDFFVLPAFLLGFGIYTSLVCLYKRRTHQERIYQLLLSITGFTISCIIIYTLIFTL